MNLLVKQGNLSPDHQDLSAYNNITEIVIHNNSDPDGTGYDTISYTTTTTAAVPEPATVGLMALGLLGLIVEAHRRGRIGRSSRQDSDADSA